MKTITVRNVPADLATALDEERRRRGTSLNRVVIDLLRTTLGAGGRRRNGLARLAGTWSEEEHREFERAVASFERVDEELWQ